MFGSDWPVCTLAADCKYANVFKILNELLPALSEEDKKKVFRENAKKFYSLQL
jgi:predicted TIM-barrel fold metal-dependent hydrolase